MLCPVLWKGQWQVLPTLPGLRRLCLVHCRCEQWEGGGECGTQEEEGRRACLRCSSTALCMHIYCEGRIPLRELVQGEPLPTPSRWIPAAYPFRFFLLTPEAVLNLSLFVSLPRDLGHLREVLKVVGRCPSLEQLELHSCSPLMPPWPGAAAATVAGGSGVGQQQLQEGAGQVAPAINAAVAALLAAAAGGGGGDDSGGELDAPLPMPLSSARANLFSGLAPSGRECQDSGSGPSPPPSSSRLRELVLHDCSPVMVRHLAGAELPGLATLRLRGLGTTLRSVDVQAALLSLPGLTSLHLEASGSFTSGQAADLPRALGKPRLSVYLSSRCTEPSLYTTRGFGGDH